MTKQPTLKQKTFDDSFEHSFTLDNPVVKKLAHIAAYVSFIVVLVAQLIFAYLVAPQFQNVFGVDRSDTTNPSGGIQYSTIDTVVATGWFWVAVTAVLAILTIVGVMRNKQMLWALGAILVCSTAVVRLSSTLSDSLMNLYGTDRYGLPMIIGFYVIGLGITYVLFKALSKKSNAQKRT